MPAPPSLPRFSDSLEDLLLRFDVDWNQPSSEQLRAAVPAAADAAFLIELIRIDAGKRLALGHTLNEAFYLQAVPELLEQPELLQNLRSITFTPMPLGDSVLRALAATTPVLQKVNLPGAEGPQTTAPFPVLSSTLPEHRYKLEGEIARGGMGAVLRGRDEDLGREIAVKVMLQNHAGKTELLQRFVEEAQIAGQLQHPGITPVYELGRFPDQRPYFTMKLVRGQTLAKLLKDRPDPASERSRFLKVFEQICQTLAYAHTRKVIHRDLKPHNIMVGSFGEVQVMDWGLAKVLTAPAESGVTSTHRPEIPEVSESSVQTKRSSGNSTDIPNTQAGSVLGTPAYMAPEQARGDIDQLDERADVFGLGTILCEILTGKPPYIGSDGMEIYRKAVDADLSEANTRLQSCGADPELITLAQRCLAANRDDRPRDASVLTKELTGYLHSVEDRLKQAELTAVKATTKAEEESKRRRVTFRLAAVILLTLLTGLAVSLWQMRRAMEAEELARENEGKAIVERDEKEKQRQRAETNEKLANDRLVQVKEEKQIAQSVRDFLQNKLLGMADTRMQANSLLRAGSSSELAKLNPTIRELLDRAATELTPEKLIQNFPEQHQLQAELLKTVGVTYRAIGEFELAIKHLARSTDLRKNHPSLDKEEDLDTQNNLAVAYLNSGMTRKAMDLFKQVHAFKTKELGAEHSSTLITLSNLGVAYLNSGNVLQAIETFKQVRDGQVKLQGAKHPDTLTSLNNLSQAYRQAGQLSLSIELLTEVRKARNETLGPDHPDTLMALSNLAVVYVMQGKQSQAIELYDHIRDSVEKKMGFDHPDTLRTINGLANAYLAAGKLVLAVELYEKVYQARVKKLGADHPDTLTSLNGLANIYRIRGQMPRAIELFEQVRAASILKRGADHPDTLLVQNNLANVYDEMGKVREAHGLFEQTHAAQVKILGAEHPSTLTTLNGLAVTNRNMGKPAQAIKLLEQVHRARIDTLGANHPDTLTTLNNLASAYLDLKKYAQAIELLEQIWAARLKQLGAEHLSTLESSNNLAIAYLTVGDHSRAIELFEPTRHAMVLQLGADHPSTLTTLNGLAGAYRAVRKLPQAIDLFEQVRAAQVKSLGEEHISTIITTSNLAGALRATGKLKQAIELYEQIAQVMEKQDFASMYARVIISNTVDALEEAHQYEKAEVWQRKWTAVVKKASGVNTPAYAGELVTLGANLLKQKRWADSEISLRESLAIREKTQPDVWTTFNTQSLLGEALSGQKKYADAEPLLLKGYEGVKQREKTIPLSSKIRLADALDRLIQLYTETNKPDEVKKWQAEKDKLPKPAEKKP